ncbi:MAG TPA: argininosuccinate synthase [Balneolales bacterium]|nr:argininosuccinate synthase [Balneolales bacterium]
MKKIVLAYSGGLDTSFCIPYLTDKYNAEIYTVTVDCAGLSEQDKNDLESQALKLGAKSHTTIDGTQLLYDQVLSYLIKGNVLRDRTYPLSVGSERFIQAKLAAEFASAIGADAIAHGSTSAGNDQIRFDTALKTLNPDLEIITPIRDEQFTRAYQTEFLKKYDVHFSSKKSPYSINSGLWGTTVGGHETLTSEKPLPFEAFPHLPEPENLNDTPEVVSFSFEEGLPTAVNGISMTPLTLLKHLENLGIAHGIGRGMHTGDTIIGIKGRIGFEAPVATLLYTAHSELEKIVLTKWQRHLKNMLSDHYGMMLHEAQYFDPVMRDIEAFFDQSQKHVTGTIDLHLYHGSIFPQGASSPFSLMKSKKALYGEQSQLWSGEEAKAFSKIYGLSSVLSNQLANKQEYGNS